MFPRALSFVVISDNDSAMSSIATKQSDAPLHVLHVCAGNLFGGVERMLLTLAEERHRCPAMIPHFAVSYEGEVSRRLRETGVDVSYIGPTRFIKPWTIWGTRARARRVCREKRIDVTIAHGCWAHAVLGTSARPRAIFLHDTLQGVHWLERRALRVPVPLVIANSQFTARKLPVAAFSEAKHVVVHCPSNPPQGDRSDEERSRLRRSLQTGDADVVIVMASRWEPYKGHELLVQALGRLQTSTPWTLWIAGGTQREHEKTFQNKVLDATRAVKIDDRIRLLGQRNDVPAVLAAADIHCQPNISPEPFGLTFVEALAAGLTVITTRCGGGEEILVPDFGILTAPGDADELASALKRCIESQQLRAAFAVSGPARAGSLCDPAQQLTLLCDALRRIAVDH